ncbi:hypothetical protein GTY20_38965 [Streptomyces sp. SID4946]|uniref:hypothetical protein n=1 Tax=Streptomyces sp. LamerLS-31b TaxID=1839765 RepID=UPI00081DBA59|nr:MULTISPECIES: hypothetical protein [unclassified Streptomyces]MYQ96783.1 hypothetical protein [Streptomyces sp. SID4946]SCF58691.1 hypothetical protein GA0115258_102213 [Streptomyces sp. LamerLS-31b]SCG02071.1 hypothetical protein GA0115256_14473 [Streptomyces sp. DconLS]
MEVERGDDLVEQSLQWGRGFAPAAGGFEDRVEAGRGALQAFPQAAAALVDVGGDLCPKKAILPGRVRSTRVRIAYASGSVRRSPLEEGGASVRCKVATSASRACSVPQRR